MPRPPRDDSEFADLDAFTTGARPFARNELVACPACRRANAPTRMKCLYCGAALQVAPGADDQRRPTLRPLEPWEQGFNVVLLARAETAQELPDYALAAAAELLRVKPEELQRMTRARTALPLARTALHEEAALLERRLAPLGLACEIVSDEELAVEAQPPRRVRRFEFTPDALVAWASADDSAPQRVAWGELVLLVTGRISRRQIEVDEVRGRGGARAVAETREFQADEAVLDLYTRDAANLRVVADTFDYTCLGAEKSLLAAENFARLGAALRARAPVAVFDLDYAALRHLLQTAWPVAAQTAAGGVRRTRPGRVYTEAVTSVSNEAQFTRYGRLRHYLLLRPRTQP